jgi:hypothetical protein
MLRIPHCLDNRLTDGGKVVSPTHRPHFTPQKHYYVYVSGNHFCQRLSKPQGLVRPEGLEFCSKFLNLAVEWHMLPSSYLRVGNLAPHPQREELRGCVVCREYFNATGKKWQQNRETLCNGGIFCPAQIFRGKEIRIKWLWCIVCMKDMKNTCAF